MKKDIENKLNNQNGQTFLEFIFLMLIIVTISFGLISGVRASIGDRWQTMVKIVAFPNQDTVVMP